MQETNPFNRLAEAARKPAAILATTATLAAGVALETPVVAFAQPTGPKPALAREGSSHISPQNSEHANDAKAWPVAVAALVAAGLVAASAIWSATDKLK